MSNNQTNTIVAGQLVEVEKATVKPLTKMLATDFKVKGLSKLRKAGLVRIAKQFYINAVHVVTEVNAKGVEEKKYFPRFDVVAIDKNNKKIKTTKEAFAILSGNPEGKFVVADVAAVMSTGVTLMDICKSPEDYLSVARVPAMKEFVENFNPSLVTFPTREMGLVWVSELNGATVADNKVVVKPRLELRAQNHLIDALAKVYVFITRNEITGEIEIVDKHQAKALQLEGKSVKRVRDMRYVMSMDYNLPVLEGEKELTRDQRFLQSSAVINGVWFNFNGTMLCAEYFMASASERRTVMGTHIVGMDAVEALHTLGMDFRQFAKYKNGKYTLDMMKAPTRFGLASTSTVPSTLIKIGNTVKELENGEFALVGGTHTMKVVKDVFSYVRQGEYLAYDPEKDEFVTLDAAKIPFKRNATDGLVFADATVQFALNAEFGKLVSSEQVRITPATKGLVVFVPGLKDMCGHDLLAFESATKGDYRTLLRTNPDFKVEFRIAITGKNAKDDKKKTNIPYQMIQTIFDGSHVDALKQKLDVEIEEAFKVYDSPEKLAEYLGTKTLEIFDGVAEDELTEEQRESIDNTLVSMFTNFFYAGDFVMEDPYFKKRILDIIENMLKAWTRGSMPVEGHYRFMVTDVYGVMKSYMQGRKDLINNKEESAFIDEDGDIIVPSHVGIPANHVVMVDDEDKYFLDGQKIMFNRNPKISSKETAVGKAIIMKEYFEGRKKYPFAFNNLVMFSCHDFLAVKQGGADFDGDKSHASRDKVMLDAYKEEPALLDLTMMKDGTLVEGCPFQPKTLAEYDFYGHKYRADVVVDGVQFNDEFKVTFTDADYNMDFARKMHELSKVFVLRSLDPNAIGQLTNFATKILAAISRLQWCLANNVDVDSEELTDFVRSEYEEEIEKMKLMVDKLRLLQGWEIDKAKHGGAFWTALEAQLAFITDSEHYPKYATKTTLSAKGLPIVRYANLEWHKSASSPTPMALQNGEVFPSLMQELRAHVLLSFTTKIKARFNELNPSLDSNNLIFRLAPVANVHDHGIVEAVIKMTTPIFKEYGQAQIDIMNTRKRFEEQRATMNFATLHEVRMYDRRMKHTINIMMDKAVTNAQAQIKALPFDEPTIAYITYAKKYREYRPEKAASPASGLSFPWVVCQDGMLELVARASGKSTALIRKKEIAPAPVKIRFRSFEMPSDKVATLFNNTQQAAVWYHVDEVTGNYMPFVYIGKVRVGALVEESAYYFTGGEKFVFTFANFDLSKTGKSASAVLTGIKSY